MSNFNREMSILVRSGYVKMFKDNYGNNTNILNLTKTEIDLNTKFVNKHNITTGIKIYHSHGKEKDNQIKRMINWFINNRLNIWREAENEIIESNISDTLSSRLTYCLNKEFETLPVGVLGLYK